MLVFAIMLLLEAVIADETARDNNTQCIKTPRNCSFEEYNKTAQRVYPDWCEWTSTGWHLNTIPGNSSHRFLSFDRRFLCARLESAPFCSSHRIMCMSFLYLFLENDTLTLNVYMKSMHPDIVINAVTLLWTASTPPSNSTKNRLSGRGQIPLPRMDNLTIIIEVQPIRNDSNTVYIDDILFVERDNCFLFPTSSDPNRTKTPLVKATNESSQTDASISSLKCSLLSNSEKSTTTYNITTPDHLSLKYTQKDKKTSFGFSTLFSATSTRGTFGSATTLPSDNTTTNGNTSYDTRQLSSSASSRETSNTTTETVTKTSKNTTKTSETETKTSKTKTKTTKTSKNTTKTTETPSELEPSGTSQLSSAMTVMSTLSVVNNASAMPQTNNPSSTIVVTCVIGAVVVIVVGLVLFILYRRKRLAVLGECKTGQFGTVSQGPGQDSEAGKTLQSSGRKSQNHAPALNHQASEKDGVAISQINESSAGHGTRVYDDPSRAGQKTAVPASPDDLQENQRRTGTVQDEERQYEATGGVDNVYTDIAESGLVSSRKAHQNNAVEESYYDALNSSKNKKSAQKDEAAAAHTDEATIYSHLQGTEEGVYNDINRHLKTVVIDEVYSHTNCNAK